MPDTENLLSQPPQLPEKAGTSSGPFVAGETEERDV